MKRLDSFVRSTGFTSVLLIFAVSVMSGQEVPANGPSWQTVTRNDRDFSVTLPGEWVVQKEAKWDDIRILAAHNDSSFSVSLRRTDSSKTQLKYQQESAEKNAKVSTYRVGNAEVGIHISQGNAFRVAIYVATPKGFYSVVGSAASSSDEVLNSVISSIRLSGQPVIKGPAVPPSSRSTLDADDLQSSQIVVNALNRKQVGKIELNSKFVKQIDDEDDGLFTRRLLILSKDRPSYTDSARQNQVQGKVRLLI
ncbi:MAG: hypothetical protein ABL959_20600, partial [Pyrinomonadaceae bacterium]